MSVKRKKPRGRGAVVTIPDNEHEAEGQVRGRDLRPRGIMDLKKLSQPPILPPGFMGSECRVSSCRYSLIPSQELTVEAEV